MELNQVGVKEVSFTNEDGQTVVKYVLTDKDPGDYPKITRADRKDMDMARLTLVKKTKSKTGKTYITRDTLVLRKVGGRIEVLSSPFSLKDSIKSMSGSKWHGYDPDKRLIWSFAASARNFFQLEVLQGLNPYIQYDQPLKEVQPKRDCLMVRQLEMFQHLVTYKRALLACAPRVGKTLATFEAIEHIGAKSVVWVGPKSSLPEIETQLTEWDVDTSIEFNFMTYEGFTKYDGDKPDVIVFDEADRLNNETSQATQQAYEFCEDLEYVFLLAGTPSSKNPSYIYPLVELCCPGFLKEGSAKQLLRTLGIFEPMPAYLGIADKRIGWNEKEIERLNRRLKGLMLRVRYGDCPELQDVPRPVFSRVYLKPVNELLKVAQVIQRTAKSTITGLAQLRQLSGGFMYKQKQDGVKACPVCDGTKFKTEFYDPEDDSRVFRQVDMYTAELQATLKERQVRCTKCDEQGNVPRMKRVAYEIPCPKEDALREQLALETDCGRILVYGAFEGDLNRIQRVCEQEGWEVIRYDAAIYKYSGPSKVDNHLAYFKDVSQGNKVAFVANPESGGAGLTLSAAKRIVYWSNSYKSKARPQSAERCGGFGQKHTVQIVDLIHLPSDEKVLDVLSTDLKMEGILLGDLLGECFNVVE